MERSILILILILILLAILSLSGCGLIPMATGDDTNIQGMQANDGTWCYVLYQGGVAKGLSCK